jgi:L-lactate dehydrogenase
MKVGVVGMGYVGSSVAISTLQAGVARDLWLNDLRGELAEGEALDLAHGGPFLPACRVRAVPLDEMAGADVVVIAAGRGGSPGEDRLALLADNVRILHSIGEALRGCQGTIVVVTNPVDVMTHVVTEASGLPAARVIGTGTMLDTARLRHVLARELQVAPRSAHAYVVGEHGNSEVPLWSCAQVGGRSLREWPGWGGAEQEARLATEVRRAAYEIIARKGATNHAIGLVTASLLRCLLRDERRVLCVSRVQDGAFGLKDVALSLPTLVSARGAEQVIEPTITGAEREQIERSAAVLREAKSSVG